MTAECPALLTELITHHEVHEDHEENHFEKIDEPRITRILFDDEPAKTVFARRRRDRQEKNYLISTCYLCVLCGLARECGFSRTSFDRFSWLFHSCHSCDSWFWCFCLFVVFVVSAFSRSRITSRGLPVCAGSAGWGSVRVRNVPSIGWQGTGDTRRAGGPAGSRTSRRRADECASEWRSRT